MKLCVAFVLLSSPVLALEKKPWLGDVYEFTFQSAFAYSRFCRVEGAAKQLSAPVNSRDIVLDVGLTLLENLDAQIEGEFGKTNQTNWSLRSAAMQGRLQLLDDISGDPISLTMGIVMRWAPTHFLKDVSTPYAAQFNTELTAAIGKEWSSGANWAMRMYSVTALGMANRGGPWITERLVGQYNLYDAHRFSFFALADFGFGGKQHVNVKHFHGWGKYQHQSVDLGIEYGYKINVWGVVSAAYAHRVFAHNFPEHVNFFMLSYCLPFSLF